MSISVFCLKADSYIGIPLTLTNFISLGATNLIDVAFLITKTPPARKGLLRLWDHAWKHRRSVEDIFDRDEAEDDEGEGDEYTY